MEVYDLILMIGCLFTILLGFGFMWTSFKGKFFTASMIALAECANLLVSAGVHAIKGDGWGDVGFTLMCSLIWIACYAIATWRYKQNKK